MDLTADSTSLGELDHIGVELGIDQSSRRHGYLNRYESILSQAQVGAHLALIANRGGAAFARAVSTRFPSLRITLISFADESADPGSGQITTTRVRSVHDAVEALLRETPPDYVIEDGRNFLSEKRALFQQVFPYVKDGGLYICEDTHAASIADLRNENQPDVLEWVLSLTSRRQLGKFADPPLTAHEGFIAAAMASMAIEGNLLIIVKRGNSLVKTRDSSDNSAIWQGRLSGRVHEEEVYPATTVERAEPVLLKSEKLRHRFPETIEVPPLRFRRYSNAIAEPRQVLHLDGVLLPDTFRLFRTNSLKNNQLVDVDSRFASLRGNESPDSLAGSYFYFDSEFPHIFGHATTEIISRSWAWDRAVELDPEVKALISVPRGKGKSGIKSWVSILLEAIGVTDDRVVTFDRPVQVEKLYAGTPMFSNFGYAHPELPKTWGRIKDSLLPTAEKRFSDRVFLTRTDNLARPCRNREEVEKFFSDKGFEIVRPELFSLPDQIRLFDESTVIAGFAGSGLISTIFGSASMRVLAIGPQPYNAVNEALISAALGNRIAYHYEEGEIQHPAGQWSQKAYESGYTVDLPSLEVTLARLLGES